RRRRFRKLRASCTPYVVEGTVLRVGDRVRITAQLIAAPEDRRLWAESYEPAGSDVLALQLQEHQVRNRTCEAFSVNRRRHTTSCHIEASMITSNRPMIIDWAGEGTAGAERSGMHTPLRRQLVCQPCR